MRVPDIAYRFLWPIDTSGPTLETITRNISQASAASILDQTITGIPGDKILVLTNAFIAAEPNGAQGCVEMHMSVFTGAGSETIFAQRFPTTGTGAEEVLNWSGEIWMRGRDPGGASMRFHTTFSGALANVMRGAIQGFIIPRGNVAPF